MVMERTGHALHDPRMVTVYIFIYAFSEAAFALFSTGILEISEVIACLLRVSVITGIVALIGVLALAATRLAGGD